MPAPTAKPPAPLIRGPRADQFAEGFAYHQAGDLKRAERIYLRILKRDPIHANALHALGLVRHAQGKHGDAVAYIRKAISLHPTAPVMYLNLGVIFEAQHLFTEAMACYQRAIKIRPTFWEGHFNLGNVYSALALHDESVACFERAAEINPNFDIIQSNLIFQLDASQSSTAEQRLAARKAWAARHAAPPEQRLPHQNDRTPDRKLRVGYVSGDLRAHSAWLAISPIVLGHNRGQFTVYLYSANVHQDGATALLKGSETVWRDVVALDDDALAAQIRADEIDILVDLSAFTANNRLRLFTYKPAPIQVTAWGYAGGTGLPQMDYAFADETTAPDPAEFVEHVVYLPSLIAYNEPSNAADVGALPATLLDGLVTFGSFNRPTKYTQRALDVWARVLNAVPRSRLMLKHGGLVHTYSEQRIRESFEAAGVATDRVRLFGHSQHHEHLDAYNDVDIQLDPIPQNGGITTLEAAWMGVPTLTVYGDRLSGRTSASYMQKLGLPEYVTQSDDGYVERAIALAADLPRLAEVRAGLRDRMRASSMLDHQSYVVEVEMAYRRMWLKWLRQQESEAAA